MYKMTRAMLVCQNNEGKFLHMLDNFEFAWNESPIGADIFDFVGGVIGPPENYFADPRALQMMDGRECKMVELQLEIIATVRG